LVVQRGSDVNAGPMNGRGGVIRTPKVLQSWG